MKSSRARLLAAVFLALSRAAIAQSSADWSSLEAAFAGAQKLDLRTSRVSSVVTLREVVKIPPPSEPVLVKTFRRESMPKVLEPAFANPHVSGVTIAGRFVAIIHTDLAEEREDILRHELVHAYITLASPKPLPFWFQEGSAVYFSTGDIRKFYGEASKEHPGMMIGKTVEVDPVYKQKLRSFQYLIQTVGDERFRKWFRQAVMSGHVDARTLTDDPARRASPRPISQRPLPTWLYAGIAVVVVAVLVIGFYVSRREEEDK